MDVIEQTDKRLVLRYSERQDNWAYHAFAAFLFLFGLAFFIWTDLEIVAYGTIVLGLLVSVFGYFSRDNWQRLLLDREQNDVVFTSKSAFGRKSESIPLSKVHSVIVKEKEVVGDNRRYTTYRTVIRPVSSSGFYAIGIGAECQDDAQRMSDLLNAWLGTSGEV